MLQVIWRLPDPEKGPGNFFIRTKAGDFPCAGWRDRVMFMMNDLITTTLKLLNPTRNRKKDVVIFGPYLLAIEIADQGMVRVSFWREYLPTALERLPPVTLPLVDYCQILLESGQRLLEACRVEEVALPSDLERLERRLETLKASISTL
jgi:hypothetical protein